MKKICIVILNWNRFNETKECLDSLTKLEKEHYYIKVLVIDNASTDGSSQKIKDYLNSFSLCSELIVNHENLGFAGGNNIGIKKAIQENFDYILLINNDTIADPKLISNLAQVASQDSQAGLLTGKIYFAPGFEYHKNRYKEDERGKVIWYAGGLIDWDNIYCSHQGVDEVDKGQYEKISETNFITGCCMLIRKEVVEKIGLFDEKYYLYLEDVDLSVRAKRAGYKLLFVPEAKLWHKNASSSGKPGSALHTYYQTRNRLLFGFKYAKLRTKIALFKESLQKMKNKAHRKAVIDFYSCRLGKGNI